MIIAICFCYQFNRNMKFSHQNLLFSHHCSNIQYYRKGNNAFDILIKIRNYFKPNIA